MAEAPTDPSLLRRRLALAATAALAGCAAPSLRIDGEYNARSQESRALFLILHYTNEGLAGSLRVLTEGPVSAHYLVTDESPPRILRLVDENRRAWHAGESSWKNHAMLNSSSIGIEIVNLGAQRQADGSLRFAPFAPAQIDALIPLIRDIAARHQIKPERILGHSDIAPQRKIDPGPLFPWQRLGELGIVPWPDSQRVAAQQRSFDAQLPEVAWFQRALATHGFRVPEHGVLDDATRRVIAAFQMKYRPARYDGTPDSETAALLQVLNSAP